ncbi:MAG: hypothetical protein QOG89_652, partial [Thermomicrobiales bacterium]|nr:hypothetical protein [Thermomicrobiales bacterium]
MRLPFPRLCQVTVVALPERLTELSDPELV